MNTKELIENTDFHDSCLTEMSMEGNRVRLRFEHVWVDDDNCYQATVTLGGVSKVTRDDEVVNALRMEGEGSSVLAFNRSGHTATMILVWRYYSPRKDETCSYTFDFTTFDLQAERQD
jgi:hypothetical protein